MGSANGRWAEDDLTLDDFDRIGSYVPLLVDRSRPVGSLMDDFYRAGGLREVHDLLDPTAVTVTGRPLVDYLHAAPIIEDFHARIDDPQLDVDANTVLVLRGCGPKGYPGMSEVSNMPLPKKLLEQGVRDMVRICDGRMSGTAYGTVVLHVAPEAAAGGPLGLVQMGDEITLDVPGRTLTLEVSEEELRSRRPNAPALGGGRSRRLRSCKIAQT